MSTELQLQAISHCVVSGNYLNLGRLSSGGAWGFRTNTFEQLSRLKSTASDAIVRTPLDALALWGFSDPMLATVATLVSACCTLQSY